jgi:hypothetical protein
MSSWPVPPIGDYDVVSLLDEETSHESLENAETIITGIERYLKIES